MTYEFTPLPYSYDALQPYIGKSTLEFHYGGHYKAYIDNYNRAIAGTKYASQPIEMVIKTVYQDPSQFRLYVNAAQVWNHSFYWQCMSPNESINLNGVLSQQIDRDFGSFEQFVDDFKQAAMAQFGSGWVWLVLDNGVLKVTTTSNADNPVTSDLIPLLTMDLWEHAYYLDYPNRRSNYVKDFITKLVNWNFVSDNLAAVS